MISRDETERLAAMANALRPDWPIKSLATFIGNELTRRTYREVAVALAWVATDPTTSTPKRMLENGPWWQAGRAQAGTVSVIPTPCGEHPSRRAIDCPECRDATSDVDHARGAAGVRAALRRAPKLPTPEAIARDAEDRRAAHRGASA